MSTRTFEELKKAVMVAIDVNDATGLVRCADELEVLATAEASPVAALARGWVHYLRGENSSALEHLHRSLALFEKQGDRSGVARVTNNIGHVHRKTGNYQTALEHHRRALVVYEELTERSGVARVTHNIGIAHGEIGRYSAALEEYQKALAIYEELTERSGVARVILSIGNVHYATGNYSVALEHYHRALALHAELNDRSGVAIVTGRIGAVHNATGNYPAALEHLHRALAVHEELGIRSSVAVATVNIGTVYHKTGNYPAALEHYHRALALHQELGERSGMANAIGNIGVVYMDTGNYPAALEHYHRALALCEELGDRRNMAVAIESIGIVQSYTGNYTASLQYHHRALALHEELGDRHGVALVTGNIASVLVQLGENTEAEALVQRMDAMTIAEPEVIVSREQCRAQLQQSAGNLDDAVTTLQAALTVAREHLRLADQANLHESLRELALKRNDLAGYVEHNNEYTRITDEINGKEATLKMAMQEKQREIEAREKEHQKHLAVLHSTLPKHIADRVARGETVNDHHENASVIFLDIVGFTSISDRIPSGHVVHLLEQIFTTLDTVCEQHNVVKIKTIGDSYMAVAFQNTTYQTPNTTERLADSTDVVRAAHCAVDMMRVLNALQITMPPSLGDTSWTQDVGEINVRIGMHCGPVTAGVIGTARMQYDVWGDTVNVASRMESTGEPGRIHVSEAFAHSLTPCLPDTLTLVERGEISVKGKGPMTTYWLEAR